MASRPVPYFPPKFTYVCPIFVPYFSAKFRWTVPYISINQSAHVSKKRENWNMGVQTLQTVYKIYPKFLPAAKPAAGLQAAFLLHR